MILRHGARQTQYAIGFNPTSPTSSGPFVALNGGSSPFSQNLSCFSSGPRGTHRVCRRVLCWPRVAQSTIEPASKKLPHEIDEA